MSYKLFWKRFIDIFISISFLILFFPFFVVLFLLLTIANKGRPLFFQVRPGKNGQLFRLVKFKTMSDGRDSEGHLLPDAQRLTPVGKFIRKTSMDEIPQLLNVIKGEMSLIGPRPLLVEYLELYNNFQKRRHEVRPGITGWAQVNGRNAITWEQKFEYDVWYVDNVRFYLDMQILLRTIKRILQAKGINQEGSVTMKKFRGELK